MPQVPSSKRARFADLYVEIPAGRKEKGSKLYNISRIKSVNKSVPGTAKHSTKER